MKRTMYTAKITYLTTEGLQEAEIFVHNDKDVARYCKKNEGFLKSCDYVKRVLEMDDIMFYENATLVEEEPVAELPSRKKNDEEYLKGSVLNAE